MSKLVTFYILLYLVIFIKIYKIQGISLLADSFAVLPIFRCLATFESLNTI